MCGLLEEEELVGRGQRGGCTPLALRPGLGRKEWPQLGEVHVASTSSPQTGCCLEFVIPHWAGNPHGPDSHSSFLQSGAASSS